MAPSDSRRSALMARVRQRDTAAEQAVRRILFRLRIGFRNDARDLPGSPDIVNRRARWVIFVHGCFWHAHDGCRKATVPKENRRFWEGKFAANRARDRRRAEQLRWLGYRVLVVWECELKDEDTLVENLSAFAAESASPVGNVAEEAASYRVLAGARESYRYTDSRRTVVRSVTISA